MLSRSLKEQIKCRWREFLREPSAFFWVVFMPILWMVALGYALSDPKPEVYGVGWVETPAVDTPLSYQPLSEHAQIKLRQGSADELHTYLQRGEVVILVKPTTDGLVFQYDQANPEAIRAKHFVNDLLQRSAGRQDILTTASESIQARGTRYVDFLIPGLLGLSIMTSSLFGIGMTIVSNRKENLLKRYLATPMKPREYIVSHIVGRGFILVAEFIAVMLTGFLIFDFEVFGSYSAYVVIAVLGAAAFTAIALLCASRTKSIPMISGMTNLITVPMIMLSGVFFSKNNFPDWLRQATDYLPLTALNDALRKIALEGQSLAELGFEISVLITYFVVATVLSTRIFRWY
jgi:ABC-type multidrug transport system permease subunit